ncbi:protease inhibitor I9 family protein [Sporosarcina luteola]|uniref:protease inhibitor I9 family protein n=1 Tax=Sporosarcina luteola TaxID=582850 RepID=UPI002041CB0D|nr:protease inhibitor I9 family protein [Sporosarcina luteola]MCM3744116.1 protease inhibitor I9 family protein [Sporosarcina luteola]
MRKKEVLKVLRSILASVLVLSMLIPFSLNTYAEEVKTFGTKTQSEDILQIKAAIAEQMKLANGGPILHEDLRRLSGDEKVDVIVHLSETPVGLQKGISKMTGKSFTVAQEKKVRQKVNAQQTTVKKEMRAIRVSYEEGYSFNNVLNGFAAKVKADDLKKLHKVKGVTLVEPDAIVHAFEDEIDGATAEEYKEKKKN